MGSGGGEGGAALGAFSPSGVAPPERAGNESTDHEDEGDWGIIEDSFVTGPGGGDVGSPRLGDKTAGILLPAFAPQGAAAPPPPPSASALVKTPSSQPPPPPPAVDVSLAPSPRKDSALASPDAFRHVTGLLTPASPSARYVPPVSQPVRVQAELQRSHEALTAAMTARTTSDRLCLSLEAQVPLPPLSDCVCLCFGIRVRSNV